MARFVAVVLVVGACAPADGPQLDAIEPRSAGRGVQVRLGGDGFCGPQGEGPDGTCSSLPSGAVDFGLEPPIARAEVVAWRAAAIDVLVPAGAALGATTVYVTVDGRSSNGVSFEVLP